MTTTDETTGTFAPKADTEPWRRAESLREEYARLGDADAARRTDAELLNLELERAQAESRRHENAYTSLLQDRVEHDRAVYAAARRNAAEQVQARAGMYLGHLVRRAAVPVTGLIHRISELPDRPGSALVGELRSAAENARWMLDGVVTEKALDGARRGSEEIRLVEQQGAEIQRLRRVIVKQGQALHAAHGPRKAGEGRCVCPGCELIRSMDDVPAPAEG